MRIESAIGIFGILGCEVRVWALGGTHSWERCFGHTMGWTGLADMSAFAEALLLMDFP